MKRILMLASVASMIDQFNIANIKLLKDMGNEVHVACNLENGNTCSDEKISELKALLEKLEVRYFQIDFARNVTKVTENFKAYKQVLHLLKSNNYYFIHCHSPIGGFCGRIAAHKTNTKVIYTAHGFHFFKGAPIINWLLYYPVERWLARYTDVLITINKEDYNRANKSFKAKRVVYIPGIGIDTKKFGKVVVDVSKKRKELGVPEDAFLLLSVGELNKNKNHETVIKAIAKLNDQNIYHVICGQGGLELYLKDLINELGLDKRVKLLGYRRDIAEISKVSDAFAFSSFREGLSVALMEAMASGLPIICSRIRGNTDLIEEDKGGFIVSSDDINGFACSIGKIRDNIELRNLMGKFNIEKIKEFDKEVVKSKMATYFGKSFS